jgi:hypothetical protein
MKTTDERKERKTMNHTEAIEQMAAERYLLDELTEDARGEFEEHLFDCQECAVDLRAGSMFVSEAKTLLPWIADKTAAEDAAPKKTSSWMFWMRPAFAMPAFAVLLGVVVFQNAVTFPGLREAAKQPRLEELTRLRPATRGTTHQTLTVDRTHGAAVLVDAPLEADGTAAVSDAIELKDAQGKSIWTTTMQAGTMPAGQAAADEEISLTIPAAKLGSGSYTLDVTGVGPENKRTSTEEYLFDIVVTNR